VVKRSYIGEVESVPSSGPKYDVAISFLSVDEPIGSALRDKLAESLSVFFYPHNQEQLAGTDGLETMRTPFLQESRVVVVLYREPWGKTPWTGVEETAIKDGCLEHGWQRLFFIMLDKTSSIPKWLPSTHVRFNYPEFSLEQAVGAIKARVQECGGTISPMTALKRAAQYEADKKFQEDRNAISSHQGMANVRQKVTELFAEIERQCAEIRAAKTTNINLMVGTDANRCVIRNQRISLVVNWSQPYTNSTSGCGLKVIEVNGQTPLPNTREWAFFQPDELNVTIFMPDLSRAREYGWTEKGVDSRFWSSSMLAERCVIQFLDLATRADTGKIPSTNWL
jgi:hypothetical protein